MRKQTTGFCGTFSFYVKSQNFDSICEVPKALHRFEYGTSLGGISSSMDNFGGTVRYYFDAEYRKLRQYTDDHFRVSVGAENIQDLIDDLDKALANLEP